MAKNFKNLTKDWSDERKARVKRKTNSHLATLVLSELREQTGMSQTDLADALGIAQPSLSQMESQDDMRITTLDRLITALGGELVITARMPNGDFRLNQFESESS